MPYQSIFTGGGNNVQANRQGAYQSILSGFNPGQYAKVNAQIAASKPINLNQFNDPVSLHNAFKSGQINKQQFQTRLFQIQSPKAGNSNLSLGKAITQTAEGVPSQVVNLAKNTAVSTGQAALLTGQGVVNLERKGISAATGTKYVPVQKQTPVLQKLTGAGANPSLHQYLGAALQTAALGIPAGKFVEEGVKAGEPTLAAALRRAATTGAKQAPAGAAFGAGQGIEAGQKPSQILKSAGKGAVAGVALGAGGSTLAQAINRAKAVREVLPNPPKSAFDNHIVESPAKTVAPVKSTTMAAETQPTQVLQSKIEGVQTSTKQSIPGERGFTTSVKNSENFSPELRKAVSSNYSVASDKQAIAGTEKYLNQPFEHAHQDVLKRLDSTDRPNKQLINDAGTVMQVLDTKGRTTEAQVIHDKLAEHLTNAGQTSQAASLLLRRSPDGLYHKAISDLGKSKVEVTPNIDKELQGLRENIRSTEPGTPERDFAVQAMRQAVEKHMPSTVPQKVYAFWRSGLITGARTLSKVATSHVVHGGAEMAKDIPGSAVDATVGRLISKVFTGEGKRSLALTGRGTVKGTMESAKSVGKYLRTGIDTSRGANADFHSSVFFGKSIPGRIANVYVNGPGRLHGSIYNTAAGGAHLRGLYSQAIAAAKNNGLRGAERQNFIEDFIKKPPTAADNIAKQEAEQATMRQKTLMSDIMSRLQNTKSPVFNMAAKVIAPFVRIPAAIANGIIDYSPAGVMKTVVSAIRTAKAGEGWTIANQRAFSQGLGRAITGSTGAMIPGIMLYNRGLLTTSYPSDPKVQKLWALQGKTPWSVKIGGKWRSLGTLGPSGLVVAMGGGIAEGLKNGQDVFQATTSGIATGLQSLQEQSYLSGVNAAVSAIQDPGRYLNSLEKQYAGSVVPTLISNIAATSDPYKRQANTPLEALQKNIPGVREGLPTQKNVFGQPVPTPETGIKGLVDPFYSSKALTGNSLANELGRLQDQGYGVMPSTVPTTQTLGKNRITLSKRDAQTLQAQRNSALQNKWSDLINSSSYKNLPDYQKLIQLQKIEAKTTHDIKTQYLKQNMSRLKATPKSAPKKK